MKIVLGSSSRARCELLASIGFAPDIIVSPDIDETPLKCEKPKNISYRLAREKAIKVAKSYPTDVVISADTVTSVGNLSLPKTMTKEEAIFCMQKLSGRRHNVYTSICVIYGDKMITKTSSTTLRLKSLSDTEFKDYIESEQWLGKAGAFSIKGFAASFVEWMKGDQESNVRGLPLNSLSKILNSLGVKRNSSFAE